MIFRFAFILRLCLLTVLLAGMALQPQFTVFAAAQLTITPLTWNVIGLDSNNVNVGPNNFPVGARVCNTGDATANNVSSAFNWEAVDPTPSKDFIQLRPGSNTSYSGYTLAPSQCVDFYYEVQATRNSNAYNDTRRYYITTTADTLGTIFTPRPREIFVEYLISQNRNAVTDVKLNGVSIPAGGTMSLMVGNTYTIQLIGKTATQGYEQLESFINFPNTIFQVNSVTSAYSANAGTDALASTKPYADGCGWVNDPGSPNYRSCTGTGKYGGNVTVTYNVTIIGGAGTSQTLNTLIYDFSGSSYHYNADFSTGVRYASIVGPSSVTITKTFTPKAITPGAPSVLTFKLTNPTTETISGVNFTDSLQGGLRVASTPNVSYSGCGAGAFSPAPAANATSLSFSNGTIAPNSTCTISVSVTADTAADYPNTTGNLFINTTVNTGNAGSDTLKVSSTAACVPGQTLAAWTFPSGSSPTTPAPATQAGNVAAASASTTTTAPTIDTNVGAPAPSWAGRNFPGSGAVTGDTSPYFQFVIDTSKYSSVQISLSYARNANWGGGSATTPTIYVWSSTSGSAGSFSQIFSSTTFDTTFRSTGNLNAAATGSSLTYFRINAVGATNQNAFMQIDTVSFTGCLVPAPAPTLAKSFSPDPIVKGAASTLTFTITNTAVGNAAQTGISFTDVLPAGLSVANSTTSACNGTNNLVTSASTRTISLTGASLAAGASCTFNVTVTGTVEGTYENITGFLSSNESGTSTSYATDTLTVIAPPTIAKSFSPTSVLIGESSALQFTITNPNQATTLTGIGFTDTLPAGVTATDGSFSHCNGTLDITGGNLLTFSGGSVNANSTCTFTLTVTGTTTGTKNNTTSVVTSTQGGNGNTASATLVVSNPQPLIGLLKQTSTDNATWVKYVGLIPTQNIYYKFTITNDGETTLNNINVSDPNVNMGACLPALPASLAVGASASCVVGPISISSAPSPNPFVNTATVTTSAYSPGPEGTSSAQYGTKSLSLDKTADRSIFFSAGEIITYSYLVTNNGGYPLLDPVTMTDDKTTVSCPAVSTVGDNDNYLDSGESITCTATYSITAGDVTAGRATNTASASMDSVTSNTDTVTVTLPPDLTVTKTNNVSGSIALGGSFNWTITVANSGVAAASFANGAVIVSDALPGASAYYPQGGLMVVNGATPPTGSVYCSITGTALACAASGAVTLPEGASFSVTFTVTPTAAGSLPNTAAVDPNLIIPELNEANNTGSNTVMVIAPPSISKSFSPNPIVAGGTSTLTFTLTNSNTTTALTGISFTDTYPSGMTNGTPLTTGNTCSGTLTAAAGGNSISLSGGGIAANGSCTITVVVTTSTFGRNTNTSSSVSSTNGGTGNSASASLAVFDAQPSKSLVTTSESFTGVVAATERVAVGEMIRYRLATRIPEGSFTNVQLRDGIPTGLQFLNDGTARAAFVCNSGASCMTSSTLSGAGLVVSGASGAVSPTFVLPGAAISGGPFVSGTDVTFSVGNLTNSDSDVDSEYVVIEFNALVLNVNATATINQGVDNNPASGTAGQSNTNFRLNDVSLLVNGSTMGSASPNVSVSVAEPAITAVAKSVAPAAGPYLPGGSLTYTLSFSNNATGNNAATAFDVILTDTFNSNLTIGTVTVSSNQGAACAGGNTFSAGSTTVGQLVTVTASCLNPGRTVTVTVNATISAGTTSGATIPNSASLTYTSLPGAQGNCSTSPFTCTGVGSSGSGTGERNGSGGPGADAAVLNNYAVTSNTVNVTVTYGSITITKDAVPNSAQDFSFTGSGPGGYNFGGGFSLDDDADGTFPNTRTFTNLVPGAYSVTEGALAGWSLTGLTCTDPDNGSTTDLGTATASIDLDAGESVICTFTNTQWITSIILTKTPTLDDTVVPPGGVVNAGDTITYVFSVENTGNVTITNIIVTDPLLPTLGCAIASLAPGASAGCVAANNIYTLAQADIDAGSRANTATATGKDPANNDVTDQDTQTTALSQVPAHTTAKTETSTGPYTVGGTITYSIVVTNTGNMTLTGVTVSDNNASLGGCTPAQPATLAPGAAMTCPASHVVSQPDVDAGSFVNTATGDSDQTAPRDSTVTVTFAQNPGINIDKTPATQTVLSGGTANFTLSVTNTGNVTLTGVVVSDPQCTSGPAFTGGDTNNDSQLQLTETWTYSCSVANVTANFTNTASVSTTQDAADSDTADVTVTILQADLSLDKSVSNPSPLVATNIDFTLSVTNTGPDTATGVQITDVIPGGFTYVSHSASQGIYASGTGVWDAGALLINQTETLTITVTVNISGSYTNYAEITASDVVDPDSTPNNGSTNEDDDDSETVTPAQNDPSGLTKAVSDSSQAFTTHPNVAIGEIVTYQVSVNVPPGIFDNARLVDTMARGLAYMDCVSISGTGLTTSVLGGFTQACSTPTVDDAGGGTTVDVGRRVTFDFGTLTNSAGSDQTLVITYRAVVLDSAANVSGVNLSNSAVWVWGGAGSLGPAQTTVNIREPDLSISKTASASLVSVGSEITITLRIQHTGQSEVNAYDAVVTDALPAELDFVPGTLECSSGAQDADVCNYDAGARTVTATWNAFTLVGGNGQVIFRVRVASLPSSGITNVGSVAWTSLPGDVSAPQTPNPVNVFSTERDYDPPSQVDVYGASDTLTLNVFGTSQGALLPATGFAPNVLTNLSNAPSVVYTQTGGSRVEISSLGINIPIVGVPLKNGMWNVSWLGNQAGWLEGSAFPSWSGNSALTGHVYLPNGLPGPFVNVSRLKYGDRIVIQVYGQKYIYEVRANLAVEPDDASVFKHEEKSWLTLVTCKEYDARANVYKKRVVIRAVLVSVER